MRLKTIGILRHFGKEELWLILNSNFRHQDPSKESVISSKIWRPCLSVNPPSSADPTLCRHSPNWIQMPEKVFRLRAMLLSCKSFRCSMVLQCSVAFTSSGANCSAKGLAAFQRLPETRLFMQYALCNSVEVDCRYTLLAPDTRIIHKT